jgi:hypothetical protein
MPLLIPSCLEDLTNEDILDIAWEADFLEHTTLLEQHLLQRLGEQCQELAVASSKCRRLLDSNRKSC